MSRTRKTRRTDLRLADRTDRTARFDPRLRSFGCSPGCYYCNPSARDRSRATRERKARRIEETA